MKYYDCSLSREGIVCSKYTVAVKKPKNRYKKNKRKKLKVFTKKKLKKVPNLFYYCKITFVKNESLKI